MEPLGRRTVHFSVEDAPVVGPFLDDGSEEHAALERLVGARLGTDSAALRALVLLGIDRVREVLAEQRYDEAVDAGDFAETAEWVAGARRSRTRRRRA
jgi:hypothetical protein